VGVILGIDLFGLYPPFKGEGLLVGVIAGLISAFGAILHGNLKNSYFFHKDQHHEGDIIKIRLSEEVSFLNKAAISETLDHIPANATVIIDASHTDYIDFDVLELIKEFRDIKAPIKNINCTLEGFQEKYKINNELHVQSVH
jgi:carbonic anhydrase